MLVELNLQVGILSGYRVVGGAVLIVDNAILAIIQTAQFDLAFPVFRIKSIVESLILADHVRLGQVEADVVELTKILSPREHLLVVDGEPLLEIFFPGRCQIELASLLHQRRKHKLRADDAAYAKSGSKIICSVTQLDMIAEIRNRVSHKSFQRFAL